MILVGTRWFNGPCTFPKVCMSPTVSMYTDFWICKNVPFTILVLRSHPVFQCCTLKSPQMVLYYMCIYNLHAMACYMTCTCTCTCSMVALHVFAFLWASKTPHGHGTLRAWFMVVLLAHSNIVCSYGGVLTPCVNG